MKTDTAKKTPLKQRNSQTLERGESLAAEIEKDIEAYKAGLIDDKEMNNRIKRHNAHVRDVRQNIAAVKAAMKEAMKKEN
jgi:hypothetical protein